MSDKIKPEKEAAAEGLLRTLTYEEGIPELQAYLHKARMLERVSPEVAAEMVVAQERLRELRAAAEDYKPTFYDFVLEVAELNSEFTLFATYRKLMYKVKVDPADPSRVIGNVDWYYIGIKWLPESIGYITFTGSLDLSGNLLASLPKSFGALKVGGNLNLTNNRLASLPKSFGSLTVGLDLTLRNNELASLPERFGSLTVGRHLDLHGNQLASLPESIGSITVGGRLDLSDNQLASLPAI